MGTKESMLNDIDIEPDGLSFVDRVIIRPEYEKHAEYIFRDMTMRLLSTVIQHVKTEACTIELGPLQNRTEEFLGGTEYRRKATVIYGGIK